MEDEKLTIWQRLSKGFGPNSLLGQETPTFKFDKKVLLKTIFNSENSRIKVKTIANFAQKGLEISVSEL